MSQHHQQQQQQQYPQKAKEVLRVQNLAAKDLDVFVAKLVRSCRPSASASSRATNNKRSGDQMMELEVRFGAVDVGGGGGGQQHQRKRSQAFNLSDYERVARTAIQHGWTTDNKAGDTMLRIIPRAGGGNDRVRAEIHGTAAIEAYCRSNTLESVLQHRAVSAAVHQETLFFTRKSEVLPQIPFPDLELRVSLAQETRLAPHSDEGAVVALRDNWSRLPKYFRHMNRVRFVEPGGKGCVALDLSIVHSNRRLRNQYGRDDGPFMGTTTGEVALFSGYSSHIEYEVELEIDNLAVAQWLRAERTPADEQMERAQQQQQQQQPLQLTPVEKTVAGRVLAQMHRAIRMIMGALQDTVYPVGRLQRTAVIDEYMGVLYASSASSSSSPPSQPYFVGPSPVTLQQEHCRPVRAAAATSGVGNDDDDDDGSPSIQENFSVTDKADGSRALLFVSKTTSAGAVYMITGAMNVKYTGMRCADASCHHLLLDGEYITRGHGGAPLNLYAAFDLYAAEGRLLMGLPFADLRYGASGSLVPSEEEEGGRHGRGGSVQLPPYRLPRMQYYVSRLALALAASKSTVPSGCRMTVRAKDFYLGASPRDGDGDGDSLAVSIFDQARAVLTRSATLEYETDGLIFTPTDTAVNGKRPVFQRLTRRAGGNGSLDVAADAAAVLPGPEEVQRALESYKLLNTKRTWFRAFKWKPPEQNTNDFLVTVVTPNALFGTMGGGEAVFYKKLKLLCGYNDRHAGAAKKNDKGELVYPGFMKSGTPFYNMLMDVAPTAAVTAEDRNGLGLLSDSLAAGEDRGYKPRAFVPSTPYDLDARFCCLALGRDGQLRAENGDLIETATIVEFRFEPPPQGDGVGSSSSWGWKPIRVRHDKTADLRAGKSEFGNLYSVANDNWRSMHYPVTRQRLTDPAANAEPDAAAADAVYYNNVRDTSLGVSQTKRLRDFHNRVVKLHLLQNVAQNWRSATSSFISSGSGRSRGLQTMIDFAVGKAGDIHKWRTCKLQFVLGLDLSRDNIFNAKDGAIARAQRRYYDGGQKGGASASATTPLPKCIFLPADSSLNIRATGAAFKGGGGEMDRGGHRIVRGLFGDKQPAGGEPPDLSPHFTRIVSGGAGGAEGGGGGGFQIGSCQFALHYFWKSPATLHGFLRNLSECIQLDGAFIGTCYDGAKIFKLLAPIAYAGPGAVADARTTGSQNAAYYRLFSSGGPAGGAEEGGMAEEEGHQPLQRQLLLAIAKKYTARTFERGPQSVGLAVSVFMESIDQAFDEYLVHFPYLDDLMGVYGFELVSEKEMDDMGFVKTPGEEGGRRSFEKLFAAERAMAERERLPKRDEWDMTPEEKTISFLNSLFVYRKKRTLTAAALDALHQQYVVDAAAPAAAPPPPHQATASAITKKRPRLEEAAAAKAVGRSSFSVDADVYNIRFTGKYVLMK